MSRNINSKKDRDYFISADLKSQGITKISLKMKVV